MAKWTKISGLGLACSLWAQAAIANVVGTDYHNFNPAMSTVDATTVHTARTLGKHRLGLGLFIDNAINTLPYFNRAETDNRDVEKSFNDSVTSLELQAVFGLTDYWDIALAIPYVVYQSYKEEGQPHGYFKRLGNTEVRLATKLHLLQAGPLDLAAVGTLNYNRVEDNPYTGDVAFPAQSLELVGTLDLGMVDWSVNAGYRWREGKSEDTPAASQEELPIDPFNDQLLASTALVFDLPATDLDVITEVYGSYARQDVSRFSPRNPSVLEGLAGFRYPLPYDLQWHGGVGAEMRHAVASSDFRVYTGIRWVTDLKRPERAAAAPVQAVAPQIPEPLPIAITERSPDAVFVLDDIYFKFDSTELRVASGYRVMELLAEALRNRPIERVVIEGHACSLGPDSYNMDLSDRRAGAVERWLIDNNGVPSEKLLTVAYGERQPKFSNAREETRRLNRRVTFKIFYKGQRPPAPIRELH